MLAAPRERWFVCDRFRRTAPLDFEQLIRRLMDEADPRAPLVWRKRFASWTRAEDVPQVERRLAPVLGRAATADAIHRTGIDASGPGRDAAPDEDEPGSARLVYGSLAAGAIALALLGWLLWPRPQPVPVVILPAPAPTSVAVPSPRVSPAVTRSPAPAVSARPPRALEEREAELPPAEVHKLRGVAAWSGATLGLTVENRTAWRVTELRVRVSRLVGDDLVVDAGPLVLLPPAAAVAPGVADLLDRVAPDRRRPGLNPLDTGFFEAMVGPPPDGFRWEIESARGYAPQ